MKKFNHVDTELLAELKQVTNADSSRYYETPSGIRYPSVTTILQNYNKIALEAWRSNVGEEQAQTTSRRAAARGTTIHNWVEKYLNNEVVPQNFMNPTYELFHSIIPLLDELDNIHLLEKRLYSDHLRLAGTVDCIAEHKGRLSVVDFKTSSKVKVKDEILNYFMQCTAYAIMYEERTGIPINKIVIIMAVENELPQIFVERRDKYITDLINYRDLYENQEKSIGVATSSIA